MSQFVVTKMRHCSALVHTNAHAVPSVHAASVMAVAIVPCAEYEEARAGRGGTRSSSAIWGREDTRDSRLGHRGWRVSKNAALQIFTGRILSRLRSQCSMQTVYRHARTAQRQGACSHPRSREARPSVPYYRSPGLLLHASCRIRLAPQTCSRPLPSRIAAQFTRGS